MNKNIKLYKVSCSGVAVYFNSASWLISGQMECEDFHRESPLFVLAGSIDEAKNNAIKKLECEGIKDIKILNVQCMELSLISYYDGDEGGVYITVGGQKQHFGHRNVIASGKSAEDFCGESDDFELDSICSMMEDLADNLNNTASNWF